MTPQERWWALRERLPALSRLQRLVLIIMAAGFACCILPFLIPLPGPRLPVEDLVDEEGEFIDLNGTQVYAVHFTAPGEVVILVHGIGGASVTWGEVLPALQEAGYDAYALDLPGAGLSTQGFDLDMSHPAQAEVIAAFMTARGIDSAHLIGHSTGANVILHLSQRHPERVKTVTLVDASIETAVTGKLPDGLLENPVVRRWGRLLLRWIVPAAIEPQLLSATEQDAVVTSALVNDYQRGLRTADWELSLLAAVRDGYRNGLSQPLAAIDVPALIVWGEADGWMSPSDGVRLAETLPDARLVTLPGVGHLPMHEAPADFNHELIDFLQAH